MERAETIDTLIAVKKTQESGSAFRPAREAEMMRRLVERHRGSLPLDTVESIWRVIISTFTYVQAPFSVHADCPPAVMRRCAICAIPRRCRRRVVGSRNSCNQPVWTWLSGFRMARFFTAVH